MHFDLKCDNVLLEPLGAAAEVWEPKTGSAEAPFRVRRRIHFNGICNEQLLYKCVNRNGLLASGGDVTTSPPLDPPTDVDFGRWCWRTLESPAHLDTSARAAQSRLATAARSASRAPRCCWWQTRARRGATATTAANGKAQVGKIEERNSAVSCTPCLDEGWLTRLLTGLQLIARQSIRDEAGRALDMRASQGLHVGLQARPATSGAWAACCTSW